MSKIIAAVSDLLFASKIAETAKQSNSEAFFVKNETELFDHIDKKTRLIIFDLTNKNIDLKIIKEIKSNHSLTRIDIIGFLPHIKIELKQKALDLGFDRVYARSEFSKKLPEII